MNENVRQLLRKSGLNVYGLGRDKAKWEVAVERFAEGIVKECVDAIDPKTGDKWIKDQTQEEFWKNQSVHLIKKHFGVKYE